AAHVLVDPGASLCFASEEFYESLVHHTPERQCDVMVNLPSSDYMHSFSYLEGVTVEVQGHQLPARLYALQLHAFAVILGMDWLEAHSAVVDCQQKTVQFEIPGVPILYFRGYNPLVDHVGIHGQRRLSEALNKDSLVRQKKYPTESSSKSRKWCWQLGGTHDSTTGHVKHKSSGQA
ncbi:hypothetical protein Taro_001555, partial [Colocasia esculenta]|nr:hypothetical protein [Colocasia esculenta]